MAILDDIVGHWTLNESSGSFASSVSSYPFTRVGSVTSVTGKIGNAAGFTSLSTFARSAADNTLRMTSASRCTITLWVNRTSGSGDIGYAFSRWDGSGDWAIKVGPTSASFTLQRSGSTEEWSVSGIVPGTWQFICVQFDSTISTNGQGRISIDNGTFATRNIGGAKTSTANLRTFFNSLNNGGFGNYPGLIDSATFWNRILTTDEITLLYNSGNGLDYPFVSAVTPQRRTVQTSIRSTF